MGLGTPSIGFRVGILSVAAIAAFVAASGTTARADSAAQIKVWVGQEAKIWNQQELRALKSIQSRELDPFSGKVAKFKGVRLSDLVDRVLSDYPPERRAQIDLIVLKNEQGKKILVPRSFTVKYPMMIAESRDGGALGEQGPLMTVPPWTSRAQAADEGVLIDTFFVAGLSQIELTNIRERFPTLFLKRRTDPAAMRGEKLFVNNCVSCHVSGRGPSVNDVSGHQGNRMIASAHPQVKGMPKFSDRDRRSLVSYFEAHQAESGGTPRAASGPASPVRAASASNP